MTTATSPISEEFLNILAQIKGLNEKLFHEFELHKDIEDFDISTLEQLSQQQEAKMALLLDPKFEQQHQLNIAKLSVLLNECKEIESLIAEVLAE